MVLNDEDESLREKQDVLIALAELAKVQPQRQKLITQIKRISGIFEENLRDKVIGRQKYGTKLGRLHELTFVMLCRCSDYKMTSSDMLELCDGDVALALEIIAAVLKVPAYEDRLILQVTEILEKFVDPTCFVTSNDRGRSASTGDFAMHLRLVQKYAMATSLVMSLSASLGARLFQIEKARSRIKHKATLHDCCGHELRAGRLHLFCGASDRMATASSRFHANHAKAAAPVLQNLRSVCSGTDYRRMGRGSNTSTAPVGDTAVAHCRKFPHASPPQGLARSPTHAVLGGDSTAEPHQVTEAAVNFFAHPENETLLLMLLLFNVNADSFAPPDDDSDANVSDASTKSCARAEMVPHNPVTVTGSGPMASENVAPGLPPECQAKNLWAAIRCVLSALEPVAAESLLSLLEGVRALPVSRDNQTYRMLWGALSCPAGAEVLRESKLSGIGVTESKGEERAASRDVGKTKALASDANKRERWKRVRPRLLKGARRRRGEASCGVGGAFTPKGVVKTRFRLLGDLPDLDAHKRIKPESTRTEDLEASVHEKERSRRREGRTRPKAAQPRLKRNAASVPGGILDEEEAVAAARLAPSTGSVVALQSSKRTNVPKNLCVP